MRENRLLTKERDENMKVKISLFYLFLFLAMGACMPYMSLFFQERGFDGREIGQILAVGSLTSIIAQPIFGMMNDMLKDYRTMLKISSLLSAIIAFAFFFSPNFGFMIFTAVLFAFINTPASPLLDTLAVERGPEFGFSYGEVRVWGAIGYALSTVIAGYVFSKISFQYIWMVFSGFSLLMFLLVFMFPKWERDKSKAITNKNALREIFKNGRFLFFISITMLLSITVTMNFSYLPIYFQKLGYPEHLVGWNFSIAAAVEIPLFWLSVKFIRKFGLFPMLIFATFAYAIKYIVMGFALPLSVVLAVQALDGVAFAFYFSAAVEIVNLMAPEGTKTTAQTVFAAAGGIAGIIANLIGGILIESQGPAFLFLMMGGIGIFAAILFMFFQKMYNPNRTRSYNVESLKIDQ